MGDRRDHFAIKGDTWTMLTTIMEERKRREIEPTLSLLRQCVIELENDRDTPTEVKTRIERDARLHVHAHGVVRPGIDVAAARRCSR